MSNIARTALRTAVNSPVAYEAGSDARPDLDKEEILDSLPRTRPLLTEGHDVHVVINEHRTGEILSEEFRHLASVPTRHDRWRDGTSSQELNRTGHAYADTKYAVMANLLLTQKIAYDRQGLRKGEFRAKLYVECFLAQ